MDAISLCTIKNIEDTASKAQGHHLIVRIKRIFCLMLNSIQEILWMLVFPHQEVLQLSPTLFLT